MKLAAYHVCEEVLKEEYDANIYEEQVGMMEMVLDVDAITEEMNNIREQCQ